MTRKTLISILMCSLILGACNAKPADVSTENPNVTLTGTITQTGTTYSIKTQTGIIELDTRKINMTPYVGKNTSVTGQYSGTTLFVDKVQ